MYRALWPVGSGPVVAAALVRSNQKSQRAVIGGQNLSHRFRRSAAGAFPQHPLEPAAKLRATINTPVLRAARRSIALKRATCDRKIPEMSHMAIYCWE